MLNVNSNIKKESKIKCVVWDLDNTIWDGVLLEDKDVFLKSEILDIVKILDKRGILQSIASKNEHTMAMAKLEELGLAEYFIYPQINWNPKSVAIETVAASINIGIDTIAFIDDQIYELEEVRSEFPQVLCINAANLNCLLDMEEMNPKFITEDSKIRRQMYMNDIERNKKENEFVGTKEEFLATLGMKLSIYPAGEDDLKRAEELTVRTHQLNTTGYTYSYEELDKFRKSEGFKLLIVSLNDRFGTYGNVGLILVECAKDSWTIKLLLMSCRVISRGIGTILINYIMDRAKKSKVRLYAEFISNERNRMMYITYKFSGFKEVDQVNDTIILENDMTEVQPFPLYVNIEALEE